MFPDAIRSEDGRVYLRYYSPIPKYVKVGKKEYVTDVKHGVSMLLVPEEEVQPLLDVLGGCCGGKRKVFSFPSKDAVTVYLTGKR